MRELLQIHKTFSDSNARLPNKAERYNILPYVD